MSRPVRIILAYLSLYCTYAMKYSKSSD